MARTLDARGLACPAPVLMVKDAIEREDLLDLIVMVDNEASRENVTRFCESRQYAVTSTSQGNEYLLAAHREKNAPTTMGKDDAGTDLPPGTRPKTFILVAGDKLGSGDDELGRKLMLSFIKTVKEMEDDLWRLVFVNNGVKLTIDTSPVLADLQAYEQAGLVILVCGTCLTHFDLMEAKKVGQTTNMLDIVTAMQLADKVISIG